MLRHDDDDQLPKTRDEIIWTNIKLKIWLNQYFPDVPIIFSIGNNDVLVHDSILPEPNNDINTLKEIWLKDFNSDCIHKFENGGYWSFWTSFNLKVISLNTLYFFKNNILSSECDSEFSPGNIQIKWLKSELRAAQDQCAKVIIIGHVPPIKVFYYKTCLNEYFKAIHNYSSIISFQCFGHTHIDDFLILKSQDLELPIGFALISPALSPVFNPSYRIYELSKTNGSLVDYHQYYANLNTPSISYKKEYSFQEEFGNGQLNFEYFLNLRLREERSCSLKIKRKRFKFVSY